KLEERRDIQQEIAHAYYRHEVDPFYWNYLYQRNIIASHLSSDYSHKRLTVDTLDVPLQRGDTILLTSDGIHDNLTDDEIAEIVANRRDTAQMLVRAAQARSHESHNQVIDTEDGPYEADYFRPKPDDMTAITMHISGVSS
ncbi:MAG: PP2C family serine/threonine-protein phosphatase, partial [Candidatus Saccharimonas sp.]